MGSIYAIESSESGLVKIGSTFDVRERLRVLRRQYATPLTLLAAVEVPAEGIDLQRIEWEVHDILVVQRTTGEWFSLAMDQETLDGLVERARTTIAERLACPALGDVTAIIRARVVQLRTGRRWSRSRLALRAGLSVLTLHQFEHGEHRSVASNTLIRLALALEVSIDYLAGLTDDPTPAARRAVAD